MTEVLHFSIKGNSMSPTYIDGDSICMDKFNSNHTIEINDIVVFIHPFKKDCKIIKRVKKIKDNFKLFVEGDNIDLASTDDSHNFGYININKIIAIRKVKNEFITS